MKANYMGVYGPRVPSVVGPILLIGVGVVALLVLTGHIAGGDFWAWYGKWWPLLLIGAGLALLGEWVAGSAPGGSGAARRQLCGHHRRCWPFMGFCAAG